MNMTTPNLLPDAAAELARNGDTAGLGALLPCFAPADGRSEGVSEGRPGRTYSTATSGLGASLIGSSRHS